MPTMAKSIISGCQGTWICLLSQTSGDMENKVQLLQKLQINVLETKYNSSKLHTYA